MLTTFMICSIPGRAPELFLYDAAGQEVSDHLRFVLFRMLSVR